MAKECRPQRAQGRGVLGSGRISPGPCRLRKELVPGTVRRAPLHDGRPRRRRAPTGARRSRRAIQRVVVSGQPSQYLLGRFLHGLIIVLVGARLMTSSRSRATRPCIPSAASRPTRNCPGISTRDPRLATPGSSVDRRSARKSRTHREARDQTRGCGVPLRRDDSRTVVAKQLRFRATVAPKATLGLRAVIVTNPDGGRHVCYGCITLGP
jgi:hypothetical protein